jgi:UDPglucose--hexose-1-phosphate uridylyltransferase
MAELRREPVARRWVVITTENPKGPEDYVPVKPPPASMEPDGTCPFCPGHEGMTPPEILSLREPGGGWSVRVVPNKSPFFHIEGEFDRRPEGMYDVMQALGAHEIVVESPDHRKHLATLEPSQIQNVLLAYRTRWIDLAQDPRFQQILILKNYPGVYNRHPHAHLLAMPVIPRRIDEEIEGTLDYFQRKERCIFCDILKEEMASGKRVIAESSHFLVFCPFASRYPFETWIVPKVHVSDFHTLQDEMVKDLSHALLTLFQCFYRLLADPPYSLAFHSSPAQTRFHREEYHWHIETRLRVGLREGFEWATGFFVNPTSPESAAAWLRSVK